MGLMRRIADSRRAGSLPAALVRELWAGQVGRHLLPEPNWLKGERPEMLPARDPEAFRERKRVERESVRERAAIQKERPQSMAEAVHRTRLPSAQELIDAVCPDQEVPVHAADGWYRFDRTFYRVGQGPCAYWSLPAPARSPALVQGRLF